MGLKKSKHYQPNFTTKPRKATIDDFIFLRENSAVLRARLDKERRTTIKKKIGAAVVIQRAWRLHKRRGSLIGNGRIDVVDEQDTQVRYI